MEIRPIARSSDLVVQQIADETLVYDLKTHKAKCLNDTSAMVWKLCDGKRDAVEISMALSAELKTNVDENYVLLAIDQLQKEELLETDENFSIAFGGVSRRDVIKKVGFAAVVALPVVSSVLAPPASFAQSTPFCDVVTQPGCACQNAPDCAAALGGNPNDWTCRSDSTGLCLPGAEAKCCICNNPGGGVC